MLIRLSFQDSRKWISDPSRVFSININKTASSLIKKNRYFQLNENPNPKRINIPIQIMFSLKKLFKENSLLFLSCPLFVIFNPFSLVGRPTR